MLKEEGGGREGLGAAWGPKPKKNYEEDGILKKTTYWRKDRRYGRDGYYEIKGRARRSTRDPKYVGWGGCHKGYTESWRNGMKIIEGGNATRFLMVKRDYRGGMKKREIRMGGGNDNPCWKKTSKVSLSVPFRRTC